MDGEDRSQRERGGDGDAQGVAETWKVLGNVHVMNFLSIFNRAIVAKVFRAPLRHIVAGEHICS
jgi:hypothetical protein